MQSEFAWSVRTSRLCAYAVRKNLGNATKEEAERTTAADAADYIKTAREHCESWLLTQRTGGQFTEDEEQAARQGMADIEAKARNRPRRCQTRKRKAKSRGSEKGSKDQKGKRKP